MTDPSASRTAFALQVVEQVERLSAASHSAVSWTQPTSCGRAPNEMPCRHPECIVRVSDYAAEFAREAAHEAHELERMLQES